jgi:hypothetical protein
MSIVILIPSILCIFALLRSNTQKVFLNFFIPVVALFPLGYQLKLPHIPPVDFLIAVTLPLGIAMIFEDVSRWKISRTDLWMMLFIFSASYTDYRTGLPIDSLFVFFANLTAAMVPYMVGKLLIEQPGVRVEAIRRFVSLLALVSTLSIVEFLTKVNIFKVFWSKFFPEQWWVLHLQVRNGFGRAGGPYGGAEHAGMVLAAGITFAFWLRSQNYQMPGGRTIPVISPAKAKLMILFLAMALYMTQSRGPWIGVIVSLFIASIGKAKRPLRRAVIVIGLGLLIGIPGYQAGKDYVGGPPRTDYGSEQETAQYRAQLIDNYIPIAKLGGAWGWGFNFPVVSGQTSIDNEFLFVWVVQGYMGLLALILLLLEASISLIRLGIKAKLKSDLYFVLTILGALLGLAVTSATVYIDFQPRVIFFLLVGWSQAIRLSNANNLEEPLVTSHQRATEPAFIRVYT